MHVIVGAMIRVKFMPAEFSAIAFMSSGPTSAAIIAWRAGMLKVIIAPPIKLAATMCQMRI
jgi:hypothetical protein